MRINADFSQRATAHAADTPWIASPMPGVDRRMLDRIGDEVARATSIVRYAPGSAFSPHVHTGGEEFLVLDGVFEDEHGAYPAGSYIRNPPQSRHKPGSGPGCVIFVKLWQFDLDDRTQVRLDSAKGSWLPNGAGGEEMPLFRDAREAVALERWPAGAEIPLTAPKGLELLVLEGEFAEGGEAFSRESWLRLPKGAASTAEAGPAGVTFWVKRGHLAETPRPPAP